MSHVGQVVGMGLAAFLGIVLGAVAVYVLGSFVLMGAHTPPRGWGPALRELGREAMFASVTQPFLPLFYVYGRRFTRRGTGVPVVFVHGYMQNRVGFYVLARRLQARGVGPLFGFNYPWFASLAGNARRLEAFVASVCEETGAPKVDLVCHSMGGLVAMEMMRDEAKRDGLQVRRCVTIASPHAGVVWRGPILGVGATSLRRGSELLEAHAGSRVAVPTLSIFSTHDNIVHPKQTSSLAARGGRDAEVGHLAHLAILASRDVAEHVAAFLTERDAADAMNAT